MTDRAAPSLFPLPLEAFERYMLADDCSPYPADGFFHLTLRGPVQAEVFEGAIEAAIARHPLMQAWVEHDGRGRPTWAEAEQRRPFITWDPAVRPANCSNGPGIDLAREIGARFFLTRSDDRTSMLMQMHHACCDGLAMVQIAEDILVEYHRRVGGAAEWRPLDHNRLRRRGHFGMSRLGRLRRAPFDLVAGLAALEYFGHRPVPLGPLRAPAPDCSVPPDYPALLTDALTREETGRLRLAAKRQGVTVNDLMLRDLFLTLHDCTEETGTGKNRQIIRIMVPMDLRVPADKATPAANLVSMTYLDRRPGRFANAAKLLASIHREMRLLKWGRAGITLIRGIEVAERLPGGLRNILPYHRCLATAVLSNIGIIERMFQFPTVDGRCGAGEAVLESIGAAPPLRPMTRASFITLCCAGRLDITLHYDSHVLSADEGRHLLDEFVERLRKSASAG